MSYAWGEDQIINLTDMKIFEHGVCYYPFCVLYSKLTLIQLWKLVLKEIFPPSKDVTVVLVRHLQYICQPLDGTKCICVKYVTTEREEETILLFYLSCLMHWHWKHWWRLMTSWWEFPSTTCLCWLIVLSAYNHWQWKLPDWIWFSIF